jgi:uncharacterized protein YaaW (UPF0174 family)
VKFILDDLKTYARERSRAYKRKLTNIALATVALLVVGLAFSIALSKIISTVVVVAAGIAGLIWLFLRIRNVELSVFIERVKASLKKLLDLLRGIQEELRDLDKDPSEFSLLQILSHAIAEEREGLEQFSGIKFEDEDQFEIAVRKKATHDAAILVKRMKGVDKDLALATYSDMLDLAGKRFKIEREGRNDRELEVHLVQTAFVKMVDAMDEKNRKLLEHEILKYAEEHLGKKNFDIALSSGSLLAANLGGFATYTMASSLLAGVGSTLGVTLPFAAYTTLSSTLSVVLGPLGIGALGLWGLHKITSPNIKITILVVLAVAAIRERLIFEHFKKRGEIENEIESLMDQRASLENLLLQLETFKTPRDAYALLNNGTELKAIESRKSDP